MVQVERLHHAVQQTSQQAVVQLLVDLIGLTYTRNVPEVKFQAAFDIIVQCSWRQLLYLSQAISCQLIENSFVLCHFNRVYVSRPHRRVQHRPFCVMARFKKKLLQVAAHLTLSEYIRLRVVYKEHVLGTLKNTIEKVCIDRVLVFRRRQTVCLSYRVGNIGSLAAEPGERPFVEREDHYILKIEISCFQHTHDLQSLKRFAGKRDALRTDQLTEQPQKGPQCHPA